jgi:hypothetical protein
MLKTPVCAPRREWKPADRQPRSRLVEDDLAARKRSLREVGKVLELATG